MKGIPTSCIAYYAKSNNISVLEIYSQLFDGKSIEFDLANNNNTCVFRNNKDHTISSLYECDNMCYDMSIINVFLETMEVRKELHETVNL